MRGISETVSAKRIRDERVFRAQRFRYKRVRDERWISELVSNVDNDRDM